MTREGGEESGGWGEEGEKERGTRRRALLIDGQLHQDAGGALGTVDALQVHMSSIAGAATALPAFPHLAMQPPPSLPLILLHPQPIALQLSSFLSPLPRFPIEGKS